MRPETQAEYIKRLDTLLPQLEGVPAHARYFLLSQFNIAFANPNFYSNPSIQDVSHSAMETNRPIGRGQALIEDVLRFMMTTEIHNQTGLTFMDIMQLDPYTYSLIRKIYDEIDEPKRAALRALQNNLTDGARDVHRTTDNISRKPTMKGYRNANSGRK